MEFFAIAAAVAVVDVAVAAVATAASPVLRDFLPPFAIPLVQLIFSSYSPFAVKKLFMDLWLIRPRM